MHIVLIHSLHFTYICKNNAKALIFSMKFSRLPTRYLWICLLFLAAYIGGYSIARFFPVYTPVSNTQNSETILSSSENWGLSFPSEGECPVGNASIAELQKYNAYYAQDTDKKVIYLTFDCGYENGNTEAILKALKKHNAPATFFVVGTLIKSNPELIKEIHDEGFTVGNHTWHHPDMSRMSTVESFRKELEDVETIYKEVTGDSMTKFYRPPRGVYSTENLKMAKDAGYHTFFWSLAYVDWYQDNQPSKEEAFDKLMTRIHPGAIVLLHSTSSTNAAIMDEILDKWEGMGYQFKDLNELINREKENT